MMRSDLYGQGIRGVMLGALNGRHEYEILEVPRDATDDEIKAAHKIQVKVWHPDRFTEPEMKSIAADRFDRITAAYEVLRDPVRRAELDEILGDPELAQDVFPDPDQNDPRVWKAMASWMRQEDVGSGFDRQMAYTAGDLLEKRRRPSERQMPHMLSAWNVAIDAGFDPTSV